MIQIHYDNPCPSNDSGGGNGQNDVGPPDKELFVPGGEAALINLSDVLSTRPPIHPLQQPHSPSRRPVIPPFLDTPCAPERILRRLSILSFWGLLSENPTRFENENAEIMNFPAAGGGLPGAGAAARTPGFDPNDPNVKWVCLSLPTHLSRTEKQKKKGPC